jgi:hypothetical protein
VDTDVVATVIKFDDNDDLTTTFSLSNSMFSMHIDKLIILIWVSMSIFGSFVVDKLFMLVVKSGNRFPAVIAAMQLQHQPSDVTEGL